MKTVFFRRLSTVFVVCLSLASCGQTGPLYLPNTSPVVTKTSVQPEQVLSQSSQASSAQASSVKDTSPSL